MNTSGTLYKFGVCDANKLGQMGEIPRALGNTFWVPNANATFSCGKIDLELIQAQALGYEKNSLSRNSLDLSATAVQSLIRQFLSF